MDKQQTETKQTRLGNEVANINDQQQQDLGPESKFQSGHILYLFWLVFLHINENKQQAK